MNQDHPVIWKCRDREIHLGSRALIMGILNVTPDSFSDGGRFLTPEKAVERALAMETEGADILDIGGESTRPGAQAVSAEEELARVLPVVEAVAGRVKCLISVDTSKASVAEKAIGRGAHIVNDVSALSYDPDMARVAGQTGAGVILMHMKGSPRTMQVNPEYGDVVQEVTGYLQARMDWACSCGMERESLALDPGIGFGKTVEHNLALLAGLDRLIRCGRPVCVGLSRKSFLGKITGGEVSDRLAASLAGAAYAMAKGAQILRVHDVKESCDVARLMSKLATEELRRAAREPDSYAGADRDT